MPQKVCCVCDRPINVPDIDLCNSCGTKIIDWMYLNYTDYIDQGEINLTELTEGAANHFGIDEIGGPLDDSDHPIWEFALLVESRVSKQ